MAAVYFLKSLPPTCLFNVVSFGSGFRSMFPAPVEYNDENLQLAVSQVSMFDADMGGTEIYSPLDTIFKSESRYPRSIFLLTDGQVGNTSQILDLIKSNRRDSRVHAFGIGSGVDRYLIVESAKVGKGAHEFVSSSEDMQSKVIDVLKKAMMPALCKWEVNCPGVEA
jgi:hypothetical protein